MRKFPKWYDRFILDEVYNKDHREYEKAVLLLRSLPLFALLATISLLQKGIVTGELSNPHLIGLLCLGTIPFSLKYFKNFKLSAMILPLAGLVLIPLNAISEGGFYANGMIWFGVLPIISTFFLGPQLGTLFTIGAVLEMLFIGMLHNYGQIPYVYSELTYSYAYKAISTFALVIFGAVFSRLYEKQSMNSEDELKKAKEIAESAIQEKNAFWTTLSHEIKTPLNGILGLSEVVLSSSLSKDQREYISHIKDSAEALNLILRDVIDFSQLEKSEISLNKSPNELRAVLDQLVSVFQFSAHSKGLQISWAADQDIPDYLIFDEKRLLQILSNLVSNAIKFTQKGQVKIIVEHELKKNHYKFIVEDSGVGIEKDQIKNLFTPFKGRNHENQSMLGFGTGLGLTISNRLCKLMGSELLVKSIVGKGTHFSFTLEALPMVKGISQRVQLNQMPLLKRGSNAYILVAEDNLVNQKLLSNHLSKLGYRYLLTSNGEEALNAAMAEKFDLILMDIQMPIMDGLTASREITKNLGDKSPKIVAVSANILEIEKEELQEASIIDYLSKPISLHSLRNALKTYCHYQEDPHVLYQKFEEDENKLALVSQQNDEMIDRHTMLEHFEYDLDLINDLKEQFVFRAKDSMLELEAAIARNDFNNIKLNAHSMKGAISNFFCEKLRQCAYALEQKASVHDSNEMIELFKTLQNGIPVMIKEIDQILTEEQSHKENAA